MVDSHFPAPSPPAPVLFEIQSGIATVTLNRPERGNAIDLDMARQLLNVASRCSDPSVRAILLNGAGGRFCVGGDLRTEHLDDEATQAQVHDLTTTLHAAVTTFTRVDAPVIAVATGGVAGAGMGLVAMADLVVAAQSASFTPAFTAVGLTPDTGTSFMLPSLVGRQRALELLLTNRRLSAAEALEWGLVTQVVADNNVTAAAAALARELAKGPVRAFGVTKRLVNAASMGFEAHLAAESQAIARQRVSDEGKEGVAAFRDRRMANFTSIRA